MKDDSARDKAIEKLVARKLGARAATQGAACLDAETLAAFFERTLSTGEISRCEAHLASCLRCQDQVAELVRLSEADQPVDVRAAAAALRPRAGFNWFRLAWAAPALIVLVIAGLWYTGEFDRSLRQPHETLVKPPGLAPSPVVPTEGRQSGAGSSVNAPVGARKAQRRLETATLATRGEPQAAKATAKDIRSNVASPIAAGGTAGALARAGAGGIATPSERARLAAVTAVGGPKVSSGAGAVSGGAIESNIKAKEEAGAAARKAPAPPTTVAVESENMETPSARPQDTLEKKTETAESRSEHLLQREAPVPTSTLIPKHAKQALEKKASRGDRELDKRDAVAGLGALHAEISRNVMYSASGEWRIGPRGLIQSFDSKNGQWVSHPSGVKADLYDITFASPSVGWAVGQAGTILLTTDGGATWRKVSITPAEDLVRVSAASDQAARVVTRSGEVLATTDSGKTWTAIRKE